MNSIHSFQAIFSVCMQSKIPAGCTKNKKFHSTCITDSSFEVEPHHSWTHCFRRNARLVEICTLQNRTARCKRMARLLKMKKKKSYSIGYVTVKKAKIGCLFGHFACVCMYVCMYVCMWVKKLQLVTLVYLHRWNSAHYLGNIAGNDLVDWEFARSR